MFEFRKKNETDYSFGCLNYEIMMKETDLKILIYYANFVHNMVYHPTQEKECILKPYINKIRVRQFKASPLHLK